MNGNSGIVGSTVSGYPETERARTRNYRDHVKMTTAICIFLVAMVFLAILCIGAFMVGVLVLAYEAANALSRRFIIRK